MVDLRIEEKGKLNIKYLVKGTPYTYGQVRSIAREMMEYALDRLKVKLIKWVKMKVPKATGQLQDDLISSIDNSYVKRDKIFFTIGSSLPQADDTDYMPDEKVQHSGKVVWADYYPNVKRKITLNDPTAIGYWFRQLTMNIPYFFKGILMSSVDHYFRGYAPIAKAMKSDLRWLTTVN